MLRGVLAVLSSVSIATGTAHAEQAPPEPGPEVPSETAEATLAAPLPGKRPIRVDEVRYSVGLGDSLGPIGLVSAQIYDKERFGDAYLVVGTTLLIINGVGVGWQRRFGDGIVAPYVNATAFAMIGLPAMCQTDHCSIKVLPMVSGSGGIELRTRSEDKTNLHLQLGVWSAYDFVSTEIFESPSDKSYIWPVINVGWTRKF